MKLERILVARHAGDPALRPGRVRVGAFAFRDHGDRTMRRRLQGEGQPGNAAADDDEIVFLHGEPDIVDQPSLSKENGQRDERIRLNDFDRLQRLRIHQLDVIDPRERRRADDFARSRR